MPVFDIIRCADKDRFSVFLVDIKIESLRGHFTFEQLQAGLIVADVEAERRNAGDIVQAERHGEFFLRLHILSGDLDLQPRGFRRQDRHAQQQRRQGQKVFYFSHGLPPLIPIKWIMVRHADMEKSPRGDFGLGNPVL